MNCVIAVSGGVDSVALLDALANNRLHELTHNIKDMDPRLREDDEGVEFVIAHFDHGIRNESKEDAKFVKELAAKYGLKFELGEAKLGENASEEDARKVRYNFLRQCCKKYNTQLITAHHQDDLIETAIINLLRGTGWRGLASMAQISNDKSQMSNKHQVQNDQNSKQGNLLTTNNQHVIRPLLGVSKKDLLEYANEYELSWREDSTNQNTDYLRNYIRLNLIPFLNKTNPSFNKKMLKHTEEVKTLRSEIENELQSILSDYKMNGGFLIPRYELIMWPDDVAREVIYTVLTQLDPEWHPEALAIKRALHFLKTAKTGKKFEVSKRLEVVASQDVATFKSNR